LCVFVSLGGIISLWLGFRNKNHTYALFTTLTGLAAAGVATKRVSDK